MDIEELWGKESSKDTFINCHRLLEKFGIFTALVTGKPMEHLNLFVF